MNRLRTVDAAIAEIRSKDPKTGLSGWALRRLIQDGEIPYIAVGRKKLISMEVLEKYINEKVK